MRRVGPSYCLEPTPVGVVLNFRRKPSEEKATLVKSWPGVAGETFIRASFAQLVLEGLMINSNT